jgi:hypothetical protein
LERDRLIDQLKRDLAELRGNNDKLAVRLGWAELSWQRARCALCLATTTSVAGLACGPGGCDAWTCNPLPRLHCLTTCMPVHCPRASPPPCPCPRPQESYSKQVRVLETVQQQYEQEQQVSSGQRRHQAEERARFQEALKASTIS